MRNWAGSYEYRAHTVHHPGSLEELRELVSRAASIKALGSRHSFTDIGDAAELVALDGLPGEVEIGDGTVTVPAHLRYGDVAEQLEPAGLALHNLGSLPHISVAGAIATATHGSGTGNLATAVAALELVTSSGELVTIRRGDRDFDGMVVSLGALGVVTRVTLDAEPAYEIRQRVFEGLPWDAVPDVFGAGYSVSVFTRFNDTADQVWIKSRGEPPAELDGARPAEADLHPLPGMDPVHATEQLGAPGRWSDRLPHFRMEFTPSAGEEIQSEYHVPRAHLAAAIEVVRGLGDALRPALQIAEIRTVAADELWLSPQYRQDTAGFHFTWKRDPELVGRLAGALEVALAPFDPRPHWGKVFLAGSATIADRYERLPDFQRLAERLDPRGAFRNAWLERHVLT
jgi:alditol oxidase